MTCEDCWSIDRSPIAYKYGQDYGGGSTLIPSPPSPSPWSVFCILLFFVYALSSLWRRAMPLKEGKLLKTTIAIPLKWALYFRQPAANLPPKVISCMKLILQSLSISTLWVFTITTTTTIFSWCCSSSFVGSSNIIVAKSYTSMLMTRINLSRTSTWLRKAHYVFFQLE